VLAVILRSMFPWTGARMWRGLAHVSLDWVMGTVTVVIVSVLLSVAVSLSFLVLPLIPLAWLLFTSSAGLGRMERSRAASLLEVTLPSPHLPLTAPTQWGRLRQRVTSRSRWVEIGYLLLLPFLAVPGVVVLVAWGGAVALLLLPAYVSSLADGRAHFGLFVVGPSHGGSVGGVWAAAAVGAVGLLLIAPWLTVAAAALDRRAVRGMLGPSERVALAAQVQRLQVRSDVAVESAEVERRRIERDLHDGAQQRLVALAMDLGRAREQLDTEGPPEGERERVRALIVDAHEEAKAALAELRDLVRGIHPAVLADRGLDAALSSVVARVNVPVDLDVDVSRRPPPAVESAAYFVVTEALTNVVRHAGASRARVAVVRAGGRLVIDVTDDGVGGADAARGSGLAGLAGRVESLGGWLTVVSPPGGPTTVMAEIPCAS
jgi:signal transduction histidine kinase